MTAENLTEWIKNLGMSMVTVVGGKEYRAYDFNNPDSKYVIGNHEGHELLFEAHLLQVMKVNSNGVITVRHVRTDKLINIYGNSEIPEVVPQKDIYMFRADETGIYPLPKDIVEKACSINFKTGDPITKGPDFNFCQYSLLNKE